MKWIIVYETNNWITPIQEIITNSFDISTAWTWYVAIIWSKEAVSDLS